MRNANIANKSGLLLPIFRAVPGKSRVLVGWAYYFCAFPPHVFLPGVGGANVDDMVTLVTTQNRPHNLISEGDCRTGGYGRRRANESN